MRMGLPITHFLAATNANDVVPEYLARGIFAPRPSKSTLSSAMDVGNPSNFARILDLFGSTWNIVREHITGYTFSDDETAQAMREAKAKYNYMLDPHGAVALLALQAFQDQQHQQPGIFLETAHPAKFLESLESILGETLAIPETLLALRDKPKLAVPMQADFTEFKNYLLNLRT